MFDALSHPYYTRDLGIPLDEFRFRICGKKGFDSLSYPYYKEILERPTYEFVKHWINKDEFVKYWSYRADFLTLVTSYYTPTVAEIETALTDFDDMERLIWAGLESYKATLEQVERGLRDPNLVVSISWIRRMDYTPTPEQIERGLNDSVELVRIAWMTRLREESDGLLAGSDEEGFSI